MAKAFSNTTIGESVLQFAALLIKSLLLLSALFVLSLQGSKAQAQEWDRGDTLNADLVSFEQVPSVLAPSHGKFEAQINDNDTISFELAYANMSSSVVQAHIHFGASKTNGGVVVFLCGGKVKPACPASGTVTGTITASDVSILPSTNGDSVIPQGIEPGNLASLIKAIRHGDTYINVHSTNFPSGEIRGQVRMDSY